MNRIIRSRLHSHLSEFIPVTACILSWFFIIAPGFASAAVFVVNTTADTVDVAPGNGYCADSGGQCSLRAAVMETNALAGADTIQIPAGIYTLTIAGAGEEYAAAGDLDVRDDVTIVGAGAVPADTIIQAGTNGSNGIDRVFSINPYSTRVGHVNASLSNLTMRYGRNTVIGDEYGGGLDFDAGTDCTGTLTITNCIIENNSVPVPGGTGGGLLGSSDCDTAPPVIITSTIIRNNSAQGQGGGIIIGTFLSATITSSQVLNNNSSGSGGGIYFYGGTGSVSISNSTISGNSAAGSGGGVYANGSLTMTNSRIIGNTAISGGGLYRSAGTVNAANNWWGCNYGPGTAGSGCDGTPNGVAGIAVTSSPWLVLGLSASPATINLGGTSTLTADITHNSSGGSGYTIPNGTTVAFAGDAHGTANPLSAATSSGAAASVYTATSVGPGAPSVKLDGQIVTTGVTVNNAATTTKVSSSANPSVYGQPVTFTANVTSPGGTVNVGSIDFVIDGSVACGGAAVSGGAAACGPISTLPAGNHSVTANYSGGTGFDSSSDGLDGGQGVTQAPLSVKANDLGVVYGAPWPVFSVTYTGFVGGETKSVLGGSLAFDTSATAGSPVGSYSVMPTGLTSNNYAITFLAGTLTIMPAGTTTSLALTSGTNPSVAGDPLTFTATVASGTGTPIGTVTFRDGMSVILGCDNVALLSGSAVCSTASLSPGNHSITAVYNGDTNFSGSVSSSLDHSVTVMYTISFGMGGGSGMISCDPVNVPEGGDVLCSIVPSDGWYLLTLLDGTTDVTSSVLAGKYSLKNVTADHTLTATFERYPIKRVLGGNSSYYLNLQAAYDACSGADDILALIGEFSEVLDFDLACDVALTGGLDTDFATQVDYTLINGSLTISTGSAILDGIIIR